MALIERGNLKTLSGPYGTVITAEGHRRGIRDLADPHARAEELVRLTQRYPNVAIIGGCCGFDHQSIAAIAERVRKVAGG